MKTTKNDFEITVESLSDYVLSEFNRIRKKVMTNEKLNWAECLFAEKMIDIIKNYKENKENENNEK